MKKVSQALHEFLGINKSITCETLVFNMQRTAFIFIIVSLIVSCTDQKVNKDIIELYFTSNMAEVNTPFHQSDFIDSVKYINILSDDKIGNISSMKYCNGYYYLVDSYEQKIWIVDELGRIVNVISHRGRAKDEYLSINDFDINPSNNFIYIYDQSSEKILCYSTNNSFVERHSLNSLNDLFWDFAIFPSGKMLFCNLYYSENPDTRRGVWLADSLGNFIKYIYKPDKSIKYNSVLENYFCRINDTLIGMRAEPGNDNLYYFNESGNVYLKYHISSDIKYDHSFLSDNVLTAKRPVGCYEINNYWETSSIMFCDIITNTEKDVNAFHQHCIIYYDKRLSKEIVIKQPENYVFDMKFLGIMGSAEDRLFCVFTPGSLPEEYQKMYPEFEGCNQPVIQVAYLKK